MDNLITFHGSIFVDAHDCVVHNTSMYKCAYFAGITFAVHESTVKPRKLDPSKISCYTVPAIHTPEVLLTR